jgi:DNA-directed RNA polymerase subunit RPC12/RpoP
MATEADEEAVCVMADITFKCPRCHNELEAPDEMYGERVDCPSCESPITVPFPQASGKKIIIRKPSQQRQRPSDYKKPIASARETSNSPQSGSTQTKKGGTGCAGWICILLSCIFMFIPVVGVFLGGAFAFVAFVLSIVLLAKGEVGPGIALLLCSLLLPSAVAVIAIALGLAALAGMSKL